MLSTAMIERLNEQINLEMFSSHLYLQMSSWCAYKALDGCAKFLSQHADEEMLHQRRLIDYLQETGALVILKGMEAPPTEFDSLKEMFEKIYTHEQFITSKINNLVHLASTEPDYSTLQFLQWYVAEQHEEEFLFKSILDKIKLIGVEGQGLFFIDREISTIATTRAIKNTANTTTSTNVKP
ncbi:Bacterial non-heme ferritin [Planktothrix agardhii]|jgi:ferritin|uniref:Ferritin n=1 Tax=Planktothrix agardhii TaxID=1160 RepID=A0A1J1J981_PLAAG|nr:non-heme ferritin [Planktothrix agardhii]MBG0745868.1 non-heme ferritin [Planktothrix agardhii KL2]MCF3576087.1 non-heme ferritin [Planktothrix agardhii 1812]MCF3580104.1 non-heme ferritin [Planktothrix agardhii 1811]CAD5965086.1 Bacterial non-heme ferritin [Planktothrix agardhii]CAD5977815.1 Bacterial non-heme ferritin [Planktothrix agardhii]